MRLYEIFIGILAIILLLPVYGFSVTIQIPGDSTTIQAGINGAVNGDTVLVAPGTYIENLDFSGKAIIVISSDGPVSTIIQAANGDSPVVSFVSGEPKGAEISGFTITGGNSSGVSCYSSSPTIKNNIITGNFSNVDNNSAGISQSDL
jgi:hypothetical protein